MDPLLEPNLSGPQFLQLQPHPLGTRKLRQGEEEPEPDGALKATVR